METKINAVIPTKTGHEILEIFAYSSKGMPGIEIIGLGKSGRALKEKIIYLSRLYRLRLPTRRYVICVDGENRGSPKSTDSLAHLELPIALIFWFLAGIVQVRRLDDCCASGSISLDGTIKEIDYTSAKLIAYLRQHCDEMKIISKNDEVAETNFLLPLEAILPQIFNPEFSRAQA